MKAIVDNTMYHNWTSLSQLYFNPVAEDLSKDRLLYSHTLNNLFGKASSVLQLINHTDNSFEYSSENIQTLLGYELDTITNGKVQFKMSLMHPEHARIFIKHIHPVMFDLMTQYKKSDRLKELNFYFTYQIRRNDGQYIWVSEKMNIIEVDENGNPLLSLVFIDNMSLLKNHDAPVDFIVQLSEDQYYNEPLVRMHYSLQSKSNLSDREQDVLRLLSEGKSSHEIAIKLNISYHTVCTHRKNMLHKTDSKNLMELLNKMKNKHASVA
jgi:DNA-binding CsgD family transcriptional regulator